MEFKGQQILRDLLASRVRDAKREIRTALVRICVRWAKEAKFRIPVDKGFARNSVTWEVGEDSGGHFGAVGSNAKYAKYIEFGTENIAGGAVKQLGLREDVTDAQAVHMWPAKRGDEVAGSTSVAYKNGVLLSSIPGQAADRLLKNKDGSFSQRPQEQMPWLRPSFMFIRVWALEEIAKAVKWD